MTLIGSVQNHVDFLMETRGAAIVAPPSPEYDRLHEFTKKVFDVFPFLSEKIMKIIIDGSSGESVTLEAVYVFEDEEPKNDGEYYIRNRRTEPGTKVALIGISKTALDAGKGPTVLALLHELAHILWGTDNPELFHILLDGLIFTYNKLTGEHIENDYVIPI